MKKLVLSLILVFVVISINAQILTVNCNLYGHFPFEVKDSDKKVIYYGCYDAENNGPHITTYTLTASMVDAQNVNRPSASFTQTRDGGNLQKLLRENGWLLIAHADYTNSGFDRGHMAPNDDFNYSAEHALLTFFIGNIWPQLPSLNRGSWLLTENETRRLASVYKEIIVFIVVDEFKDQWIGRNNTIRVPANFKRTVFHGKEIIYNIQVQNE